MWVDERVRPPMIPVPTETPTASPVLDPPAAVDLTAIVQAPANSAPARTTANTTLGPTEAEVKQEAHVDAPVTMSDYREVSSLGVVRIVHIMALWTKERREQYNSSSLPISKWSNTVVLAPPVLSIRTIVEL